MANENPWPIPKFYFEVDFGNGSDKVRFQEVSGLDTENQIIEYRHRDSPEFSTIKMPGIAKVGNVIMKKGIFLKDNSFWKWYDQIKMNTIQRQNVTISLLDEKGKPTMQWELENAWPTKITGTDLKSEGDEAAVESIELAFENLVTRNVNS